MERHRVEVENTIDYYTELDLIRRYAKNRNMPEDEVADLYNALRKWIIYKLNDTTFSDRLGMIFPRFASFVHKSIVIEDLKKAKTNGRYRRAEEQLHYYLAGHTGLKIK